MKFKPPIPRDVYTQRAVELAWPEGEWVEEPAEVATERSSQAEREGGGITLSSAEAPGPLTLTVIGGTKYDKDAFAYWLSQNPDLEIITGAAKGLESSLVADVRIPVRKDYYLKGEGRFNVWEILAYDVHSTVLLVGTGLRINQAKAWLESHPQWNREVIELK